MAFFCIAGKFKDLAFVNVTFLDEVRLRQKYYGAQVRPDRDSNSWPPDHSTFHVTETPILITAISDFTFHVTETSALNTWPSVTTFYVTETPALTTWSSVTSKFMSLRRLL